MPKSQFAVQKFQPDVKSLPLNMKGPIIVQMYNPAANHSFTIFTHVLDHPTSMLHLNTITMAIRDVKYI
jgi:hypothetical protein